MTSEDPSAQSRQSLRCSLAGSMEVDEGSAKKSDILPHWMAVHAHLKNEFMEEEKNHNLTSWPYVVRSNEAISSHSFHQYKPFCSFDYSTE